MLPDLNALFRQLIGIADLAVQQEQFLVEAARDGSWRVDETYVRVNGRWMYLYGVTARK